MQAVIFDGVTGESVARFRLIFFLFVILAPSSFLAALRALDAPWSNFFLWAPEKIRNPFERGLVAFSSTSGFFCSDFFSSPLMPLAAHLRVRGGSAIKGQYSLYCRRDREGLRSPVSPAIFRGYPSGKIMATKDR